jgi:hypothetical protein
MENLEVQVMSRLLSTRREQLTNMLLHHTVAPLKDKPTSGGTNPGLPGLTAVW